MDEELENRLQFLRKANTDGMPHTDSALLACFKTTQSGPARLTGEVRFGPDVNLRLKAADRRLQEVEVLTSIPRGIGVVLLDFDALNHDRAIESGLLHGGEHRLEVDFAGTELRHHLALDAEAVLGAEAGDVLGDGAVLL